MAKPWNKRPAPERAKADRGPCYQKGCHKNGGETLHCITCEDLERAGRRSEVFRIQTCSEHRDAAMKAIRRHALLSHPVNLLRVAAAALKGEDIT